MPKRRISKYDEFFVMGLEFAQCVLCEKSVKRQVDGGTNTMRNHLSVHHKEQFAKFEADRKHSKEWRESGSRVDLNRHINSVMNTLNLPKNEENRDFSQFASGSSDIFGSKQTQSPRSNGTEPLCAPIDFVKTEIEDSTYEYVGDEGNIDSMSIAIVQAGTVLYDTPATLQKLEKFVSEAAGKGAKLVLFPEGFVGGYPKWNNFGIVLGTRTMEGREEYEKYYRAAIEENGPESDYLAALAAKYGVILVTGVIEKEGDTLYCSVFFYSPEKYLGKHRKLMPTALERCVWGNGDGSTMPVFDTPLGKIGAAICWENYMPLYRVNLYSKGIQLYLAPTVDDREVWLSTMRTIALEGRCFVISACQFLKASDYPADHPIRKEHGDEKVLIRGGSCAVDPLGTVLVEPDFSGEMIRYVDVDLSMITKGKFDLDTMGHYSRPDVFQLHVNEQPQKGIFRH